MVQAPQRKCSSPIPCEEHTPSPGTRITTPISSPSHPYTEYSLEKDVRKKDWAPFVQPCVEATRALGYSKPKSYLQLKAMWLVLSRHANLFLLLPTGFGKTALFQFIAALPNNLTIEGQTVGGNSIVITPFAPLLNEHVSKTRAKGISVFDWQSDRHAPDYSGVPHHTRIVFIQPESFISNTFIQYVLTLYNAFFSRTDVPPGGLQRGLPLAGTPSLASS